MTEIFNFSRFSGSEGVFSAFFVWIFGEKNGRSPMATVRFGLDLDQSFFSSKSA